MSTRERMTLAAALAVALATSALAPVYQGYGWLLDVLGVVVAVAVAGLAGRRLGLPPLLQPLLGLLAVGTWVAVRFAGSTLVFGVLPGRDTLRRLGDLIGQGLLDVEALAPPVPSSKGLVLLAVLGVGGVAVLVDLLAVVLSRAAVAGLPLLTLFAVPSAVLADGLGWVPFTLGAAGWLGLLLVEGSDRVSRWGTPLGAGAGRRGDEDDTSLGRVGRRIGAAALGVAVVVPALLPGLDTRLLDGGSGGGTGIAGREGRSSTTYNPITELQGQLRLPSPRVLFVYSTNDPAPDYLRLTTLDRFDGTMWSSSQLRGDPDDDAVQDGVDPPPGLDLANTREVRSRILIKGLATKWLPTPVPPSRIDVDGAWVWDQRSQTVFSAPDDTSDVKRSYEVTSTRVVPARGSLADVGELPRDLQAYDDVVPVSDYVAQEVRRVVAGATTDFERVMALQQYFLDARRFSYSVDADPEQFAGLDPVEAFLRDGKGFCQQYASSMAAMIRYLALPARVAVGFTPGTLKDGAYTVTTNEAHAWPEVWFQGTGWIRFEPTPRAGVTSVPAYAVRGDAAPTTPVPGAVAEPTTGPAPTESAGPGKDLDLLDRTTEGAEPAPLADEQDPGRGLPSAATVLLLLAVVLALTPMVLHAVRHRRRWSAATALSAWAQVRDDGADVGHGWRPQDSPRAAAAGLARARGLEGAPAEALQRLSVAAERARYAPGGAAGHEESLLADATSVRHALLAGVPWTVRWRARLLPSSTVRWAASAAGSLIADGLDRVDDAVAAVTRRLRLRPRPT